MQNYGYKISIIDAKLYSEVEVKEKLESFVNDTTVFFGFSVMTVQVLHALELSRHLKEFGTKSSIVWGGIHPKLFPEQTSLDPNVDIVVFGHGESTTLEIAQKIESGNLDFSKTNGVAFRGKVNDSRERDDINTYLSFIPGG
ncbi:MAG: oxidoreductase [Candidatus Scalindua rubra]|uniref:Oxidoreductase n=1 Tax=Candidatus Scalindua rubra TaxID=1872076 RepID=A0A1E3X6Q3_9BACT|nr:MAG: oxidoreductase [Candidatus Scalindua rubra]